MNLPFKEIWCIDFEFFGGDGGRPIPVCYVAHEVRTGRQVRVWQSEFGPEPVFNTGPNSLIVCHYASAEIGSMLALGWPVPVNILDTFTEFRNLTNGRPTVGGAGLLGALAHFGLNGIQHDEKDAMRDLILTGGPWSADERLKVLDYCASDVLGLERLLPAMLSGISLPHALLRGRYMAAAARMEHNGIPVDVELLDQLREHWNTIKAGLIEAVDADYGVFENGSFKSSRFSAWLASRNIPWPMLESGQLDLEDETFKSMANIYPEVSPLRELREALSKLRLNSLAVGTDGRNRCLLSTFRARTGRNQPSSTKYLFGPSTWIRGLIKPPEGHAVAYVDWSQQEFGIAAALSGDEAMMAAYRSGDPYLAFGKAAGFVPTDADKEHPMREMAKQCVLGVGYGMGEHALAARVGKQTCVGRELLQHHRETYPRFWRWINSVVDDAMLTERIETVFGWRQHIAPDTKPRALLNFPMQAHGAEMMRLAACLATERGVEVCGPIHDAFLVTAAADEIDHAVAKMQTCMIEASRVVLDGLADAKVVRYPDRYMDKRGAVMWERVMGLLPCTKSGSSETGLHQDAA